MRVVAVLICERPRVGQRIDRVHRLIGVAHHEFPIITCRYHVRRDAAIGLLLAEWKARYSVQRITLVQAADQRAAAIEETVQTILEELEIKSSPAIYRGQRSEAFLRTLQKAKTDGIIFSLWPEGAKLPTGRVSMGQMVGHALPPGSAK